MYDFIMEGEDKINELILVIGKELKISGSRRIYLGVTGLDIERR